MRLVFSSIVLVSSCFVHAAEYRSATWVSAGEASRLAAEKTRLTNEINSLGQQRQFEVQQRRLYSERQQRELQSRRSIDRDRASTLASYPRKYYPLPSGSQLGQDRFVQFFNLVRRALERDDFEAVKFAAQQMNILGKDKPFTRDYYDRLRSLMPAEE